MVRVCIARGACRGLVTPSSHDVQIEFLTSLFRSFMPKGSTDRSQPDPRPIETLLLSNYAILPRRRSNLALWFNHYFSLSIFIVFCFHVSRKRQPVLEISWDKLHRAKNYPTGFWTSSPVLEVKTKRFSQTIQQKTTDTSLVNWLVTFKVINSRFDII